MQGGCDEALLCRNVGSSFVPEVKKDCFGAPFDFQALM
jgi:hypothetical protein